jgi:hypothetical protein
MFSLKNIPSDFNWKIYLERNIDLPRDYNRRDCINHYIKYGQYEKRVYRENKGFAFVLYSNRPFINCDLFNCVLECLKYKNNEPYIYQKICDNHNKINNIIETYSNDYAKLNKKMYTYSKDNDMPVSFLQIQKVDPSSFEATCQILYNELKSSLINAYESFILILDFSEIYTGGTRSFINNIIYKYSKNNNFLFLRPNNTNLYNIHINNTKILDLNITQIIQFIDLTKNKISKIFFNHAIDFSKDLLNFLLLLPIEKTLVTHDHFFLTNGNPQNTMDEVYNFLSNNVHNNVLNAVDNIISQNINNIYISNKYVYNRFIISELPDFRENDDIKIVTNNKSINILFIGDIHELKGCELVDFLCNDYYKETNIKTFIFGCLSNSVGNNTRRYKNIDEFNELLIDYKPNLIIERVKSNESEINEFLNNSAVICYSTSNYQKLTDIFMESLIDVGFNKDNIIHKYDIIENIELLKTGFMSDLFKLCIINKISHIVETLKKQGKLDEAKNLNAKIIHKVLFEKKGLHLIQR